MELEKKIVKKSYDKVMYRCPHGRIKHICRKCSPCPHGRIKYQCKDCNYPRERIGYDCNEFTP